MTTIKSNLTLCENKRKIGAMMSQLAKEYKFNMKETRNIPTNDFHYYVKAPYCPNNQYAKYILKSHQNLDNLTESNNSR